MMQFLNQLFNLFVIAPDEALLGTIVIFFLFRHENICCFFCLFVLKFYRLDNPMVSC